MTPQSLHIVSFDVPYPADYGGVIDVFYKIKALKEIGCKVYLHCFEYGRGRPAELGQYCEQVWYYPRAMKVTDFSPSLPFILSSRKSAELLARLEVIDVPVLFDGVHASYYLNHPALAGRQKLLRVHNIEHDYYTQMVRNEASLPKKMFFKREAMLLKRYEYRLGKVQHFLALSYADHLYFKGLYPNARHTFVPAFHPFSQVESLTGSGSYCLYHGNLSHPENRQAALFLIKEVFSKIDIPLVVAGKKPGRDITEAINGMSNCRLVADPAADEMEELQRNAHIHVLPTFQQSGVKLKLLSALFGGRHVVVNPSMLHGTGLDVAICPVAENADGFINAISALMQRPFLQEDITLRAGMLSLYDNKENAGKIVRERRGG